MLIEEIMNKQVLTLQPTHTMADAAKLMKERKIRHVPVVDENGKLLGLLTERDLKNALPSSLLKDGDTSLYHRTLDQIMITNPIIGHPLDFVEEVALILYEHRIGCLPIVSKGELVGIITGTDLLYTYIEITGATKPSSQMEIRVQDRIGALHEVTKIFANHHASILSVLIYPDSKDDENKILSIRLKIMNPLPIIDELRKEGFDVLWPNIPTKSRQ
ncbi:acetoin utilization AcuB family protein [Rummeliibacillus stabekisii]|uniref:acetoin utilization AcuB family protein n=1 Tax=Rummeliibacillus stabekisii TaxID=241244 RepID=UPI00117585C6|nr:acetoin utilization AcuB family protein [Rummeliibacillus stabekisii]MBB5168698.1 acetoin utilization protein AcuB [Rummeliibacillus stabekisii]GEL05164.1 acetoin utilization protein AcuB [Rummeliibacillus stabekisii]